MREQMTLARSLHPLRAHDYRKRGGRASTGRGFIRTLRNPFPHHLVYYALRSIGMEGSYERRIAPPASMMLGR